MKVYLGNEASPQSGGMYRVLHSLYEWLPKFNIEIVKNVQEADVVHSQIHTYENIPVDQPLVVSSHGLYWDEHLWGNVGWGSNQRSMLSYLQADVVTAPSEFVARAISRNTLISPKIVHHGIDTDQWLPGENRGYVLWNKARVDVANDPKEMNLLAERTKVPFISTFGQETPNVKITGQITSDQMKILVKNAGVYLDTPKESGGPCFGVLEALSCGVPILSWNYGGTAEVIEHGETGYLAEPGNYDDLLEGLNYCLKYRDRLGKNARQVVFDRYQLKDTIPEYIAVYEQAIKKHEHLVKVSIITPCYNLGKFLPYCVQSVIDQPFKDWEMIIVDDQSIDGSDVIVDQQQIDPRIKVYHNSENLHVSETRNEAVRLSRGEYILPLDADDRLGEDALGAMVRLLDARRTVQIAYGTLICYHEDNLEDNYQNYGWPNNSDLMLQIGGHNRLPYSSMYRRKVWENIGGYRRRIRNGTEDADFWTRALSYGYAAEKVDAVTLKYTLRENSLRHVNGKGAEAWLSWFGWYYEKNLIPAGSATEEKRRVEAGDQPEISVIIPVGPGHLHHLQACIDSLIAQTFVDFEIIAINDTGESWKNSFYIQGMPFVKLIDKSTNDGVAYARNLGLKASKAKKIVFLDVDDIAHPEMLRILNLASQHVDGWLYGDWYKVEEGKEPEYSEGRDWDSYGITQKMLAPITGLYYKEHLDSIGGFDVTMPGFEDWDMQLSLLEQGICGTRIKHPLITYHMNYGNRREDNFARRKDIVQSIHTKHISLYGGKGMACSKCGGKPSLGVQQANSKTQAQNKSMSENLVVFRYDGPMSGAWNINAQCVKGHTYMIGGTGSTVLIYACDKDFIGSIKGFTYIGPYQPEMQMTTQPEGIVLVSDSPSRMPPAGYSMVSNIKELGIPENLKGILGREFQTVAQLRNASDAQLLSIKGMGEQRLKLVKEALAKWNG